MKWCLACLAVQAVQPVPSSVPATPVASAQANDAGQGDVVVRARRLRQAQDECLAGRCSPERDAQVSIAAAEQQFRDGDYRGAMFTLSKGIGRNRPFAATHPKPLASLYEANATVTLHYGDRERYRTAVASRVRTLRDHLPADDLAVREASLAVADMWLTLGFVYNAELAYQAAENRARASGQATDAVNAAVHRIWLMALDNRVLAANRLLKTLADDPIASEAGTQRLLAVLRLKVALRFADEATAERTIRETPPSVLGDTPMLVWAPPFGPEAPRTGPDTSMIGYDVPVRSDIELPAGRGIDWVDIGFWITPSGRVAEVEALRGPALRRAWTRAIATKIAQRRYAPFAPGSSTQGVYRLQRFTLRAAYAVKKEHLSRTRSGPVELQIADLADPLTPPSSALTAPAASP